MADHNKDTIQQWTSGIRNDTKRSTYMDHIPPCEENKQEDTAQTQHSGDSASASSSASTNKDSKNDNGETTEPESRNIGSAEDEDSGSAPPHEDSTLDVEESSATSKPHDADDRGDYNREMPRNEEATMIPRKDVTGQEKAPETTGSPALGDGDHDKVDGPTARLNDESSAVKDTNVKAGEDTGRGPEHDFSEQMEEEMEEEMEEAIEEEMEEDIHQERYKVENIGPITQEASEPTTGILGGRVKFLIPVVLVLVVSILLHPRQPESPPQTNNVEILLRQMEKVKTLFPHQRAELWTRSRIHLQRHLQTAQPTAPVSLILTAGLRAERTLQCLAQDLASAFSFSLNASVLNIDGASKANQDSDQVKLDIDSKLQGAFEGDKPVAVIHRFEELPPGSTLIFYRYCDHENAAFKETVLIFTVLLEEEEIPAKINLNAVEELVDDHLKKKFLSHGHPVSFDRMDLDKYGGLWSRISHLILPVAKEERIEHEGC